jgi:hypothetical protein
MLEPLVFLSDDPGSRALSAPCCLTHTALRPLSPFDSSIQLTPLSWSRPNIHPCAGPGEEHPHASRMSHCFHTQNTVGPSGHIWKQPYHEASDSVVSLTFLKPSSGSKWEESMVQGLPQVACTARKWGNSDLTSNRRHRLSLKRRHIQNCPQAGETPEGEPELSW